MKHHRVPTITLAALLASSCASIQQGRDPICDEIAQFANTATGKDVHSVELATDWGGTFEKDKLVLASKHCKHNSYAPGMKLCKYLMENTSTEFAEINFRRVAACLAASAYVHPAGVSVERLEATYRSNSAVGVKSDIAVVIDVSIGSKRAPPSIKITAQGPEAK